MILLGAVLEPTYHPLDVRAPTAEAVFIQSWPLLLPGLSAPLIPPIMDDLRAVAVAGVVMVVAIYVVKWFNDPVSELWCFEGVQQI